MSTAFLRWLEKAPISTYSHSSVSKLMAMSVTNNTPATKFRQRQSCSHRFIYWQLHWFDTRSLTWNSAWSSRRPGTVQWEHNLTYALWAWESKTIKQGVSVNVSTSASIQLSDRVITCSAHIVAWLLGNWYNDYHAMMFSLLGNCLGWITARRIASDYLGCDDPWKSKSASSHLLTEQCVLR